MQIFRFRPFLKSVIWGGDKIALRKGIESTATDIGESWELSGVPAHESIVSEGPDTGLSLTDIIEKYGTDLIGSRVADRFGHEFPLLIKFIDARADLSVQVHPDDALAMKRHGCKGKTEMWYILETEPEARIYVGLDRQISPDDYTRLVEADEIMDVVRSHSSRPGDVFFLPAGRIHAIGAGNLLAEIQQTSDITYRVYDFGRLGPDGKPRELHTRQAREAIDYSVSPDYRTHYPTDKPDAIIADCEYFTVERHMVDGETRIPASDGSFTIIICTDGSCTLRADDAEISLHRFETVLVPAKARTITCSGKAVLLSAHL